MNWERPPLITIHNKGDTRDTQFQHSDLVKEDLKVTISWPSSLTDEQQLILI